MYQENKFINSGFTTIKPPKISKHCIGLSAFCVKKKTKQNDTSATAAQAAQQNTQISPFIKQYKNTESPPLHFMNILRNVTSSVFQKIIDNIF